MAVLMFLLNLIVFLIVLGVIVLIHEFGHYIVAKKTNVLVYEFAFGMGPLVASKRKGETLYSVRAIPFGGFCSMGGEEINEALIRKDQLIGLNLSDTGFVKELVITPNIIKSEYTGKIIDYDLYGKGNDDLYISILLEDGSEKKFNILRNASYVEQVKVSPKSKRSLQIVPKERSFESKPLWVRFLVIFAGPLLNFVLAIFIFLLLSLVDPMRWKPSEENIIGGVGIQASEVLSSGDRIVGVNDVVVNKWSDISAWQSEAETLQIVEVYVEGDENPIQIRTSIGIYSAGIYNISEDGEFLGGTDVCVIGSTVDMSEDLNPGDVITKVTKDGITVQINNWDDLINYFSNNAGGLITFGVLRDEIELSREIDTYSKKLLSGQNLPVYDVSIGIMAQTDFDFGYAIGNGFREFGSNAVIIFTTLGQLFSGDVKINQLSGPIGIFTVVGDAMSGGILSILFLIGLLSVNVGIMNLLPIPALDGGRILFLGIEAISRKKPNRKVEKYFNLVFFILLLALMVLVIFFDVLKLF
jgi:regulator of sigma E protease